MLETALFARMKTLAMQRQTPVNPTGSVRGTRKEDAFRLFHAVSSVVSLKTKKEMYKYKIYTAHKILTDVIICLFFVLEILYLNLQIGHALLMLYHLFKHFVCTQPSQSHQLLQHAS
jgi:hypothetical protein